MKIKQKLNLFYSTIFLILMGVSILFTGVYTYKTLYSTQTNNMERTITQVNDLIISNVNITIKNYLRAIAEKTLKSLTKFTINKKLKTFRMMMR